MENQQVETTAVQPEIPEDPRLEQMKMVLYPSPVLKQISEVLTERDFTVGFVKQLVTRMKGVMKQLEGAGLAGVQVNMPYRLFVLDDTLAGECNGHTVFANPAIIQREGEVSSREGCLSFPGLAVDVPRSAKIVVSASDEEGKDFQLTLEGFAAIAFQHEYDHLQGKTFLDGLSRLKRDLYERKISKLEKRVKIAEENMKKMKAKLKKIS